MAIPARKIIISLALLLAAFGLYRYLSPPQPEAIGFIANLSGRNSQLGVSARNGAQMALEEINRRGGINGRQFELLIRDNRGDADACLRESAELVAQGVTVILGPYTSVMAEPVLEATVGHDTLVLSPTVSTDRLSGIDDNFLRVIGSATEQGRKLAEAALSRGDQVFAVVTDRRNSEYTEAVARGFAAGLANSAGKIMLELSFQDKSEFQNLAEKLKNAAPDGILLAASGIDSAGIAQQYHKLAPLPHLYAATWSKATRVHEYGGRVVEGMILVAGHENKIPSERESAFTEKYIRDYRTEPDFASIYAYEALMLIERAARESGEFTAAALKRSILGMEVIQGVRDQYRLDPFGDAARELSLFTIKDGAYELAETP